MKRCKNEGTFCPGEWAREGHDECHACIMGTNLPPNVTHESYVRKHRPEARIQDDCEGKGEGFYVLYDHQLSPEHRLWEGAALGFGPTINEAWKHAYAMLKVNAILRKDD